MKETRMVGFSITGEFITEHVRNLVAEGRPRAAWSILTEGLPDMTLEQVVAVLCGRKKLVGTNSVELIDDDPKAPTPVDFITKLLAESEEGIRLKGILKNFRGVAGLAHMAYNPSRSLTGVRARGSPAGFIDEKVVQAMLGGDYVPQLLMRIFPAFTDKEYEEYFEKNGADLRELVRECHPYFYDQVSDATKARALATARALTTASYPPPVVKSKPKPGDVKKENNGWILPDGKFYPCDFMGHCNLACDLGVQDDRAAENLGWIRVSLSSMFSTRSLIHKQEQEATQAQINTVDLYCEAHHMELPDWAGGEGTGFQNPDETS